MSGFPTSSSIPPSDQQMSEKSWLATQQRKSRGGRWTWGYVVYRTVYTPESDALWDSIVAKLEGYMFREVDRTLWYDPMWDRDPEEPLYRSLETFLPLDPAVNAEIRDHMSNMYKNDRNVYDGLSTRELRAKFNEEWHAPFHKFPYYPIVDLQKFLVIDEEVFCSIRDAPEPTRHRNPEDMGNFQWVHPFIKVANWWDGPVIEDLPELDDVWMKASLNVLWGLYGQEMWLTFPQHFDPETGEREIYVGQIYGGKAPRRLTLEERRRKREHDAENMMKNMKSTDWAELRKVMIEVAARVGQEVPAHLLEWFQKMEKDGPMDPTP